MPYGSLLADTVQSSSSSPVTFKNTSGVEVGTLCRAWVNFNGTTAPATIRGSFNVSSVTRNSTGDYTVNFTTAMPDANYSAVGAKGNASPGAVSEIRLITLLAASANFNTIYGTSPFVYNEPLVCMSFFR